LLSADLAAFSNSAIAVMALYWASFFVASTRCCSVTCAYFRTHRDRTAFVAARRFHPCSDFDGCGMGEKIAGRMLLFAADKLHHEVRFVTHEIDSHRRRIIEPHIATPDVRTSGMGGRDQCARIVPFSGVDLVGIGFLERTGCGFHLVPERSCNALSGMKFFANKPAHAV